MSCHKHEVSETRTRSLFKAVIGRIIEISVGTLVFGTILGFFFPWMPDPYSVGFGLNIVEETLCFLVTYGTERVWNRINWGRKVVDLIANNESVEKETSSTG